VKYSTGQVVHLPTAPLTNLDVSAPLLSCDQLPIPGVPMPSEDLLTGDVTHGIVQGTNIGYIYVRHHEDPKISTQFDDAVKALASTDGLIIDLRLDYGGLYGIQKGIGRLVNFGDSTMQTWRRYSASDLQTMVPTTTPGLDFIIPQDIGTMYDRPIAVLVGPECRSYGDISAWELSYIPNAKFFGKSTTDGLAGYWFNPWEGPNIPGYTLLCPDFLLTDHRFPGVQLYNKEFPVDEEVWLTPDGVAKGEDDVVKKALEWMNNLVYPHNIMTDKSFYFPSGDTVHLSTIIENPNSHQISARAYFNTSGGVLIDSINLSKQSLNGTEEKWSANFNIPQTEDIYKISVKTFDQTSSTSFKLPNAARFTTAGPLIIDSIWYYNIVSSGRYSFGFFLLNKGNTLSLNNVSLKITCNDPWVLYARSYNVTFPTIPPGAVVQSNQYSAIYYDETFPGYFNLKFEISSDGWVYWKDSLKFTPVTGIKDLELKPAEYILSQNYPNPFNPNTTIKYGIKEKSNVKITIFNALGQEVALALNEEMQPGYHQVDFNAANLPSGVYFYRIQAGSFVETKKMILLK
jgi:hypothetical protein